MTTTGKVKNFVKQVIAQLTGDENQAIALKNARKADAAVSAQLASLNSRQVDLENTLEEAQEAYNQAKYPKIAITDNKRYIDGVEAAHRKLETVQGDLDDVQTSIKFYKELAAEMGEDVDA